VYLLLVDESIIGCFGILRTVIGYYAAGEVTEANNHLLVRGMYHHIIIFDALALRISAVECNYGPCAVIDSGLAAAAEQISHFAYYAVLII
jgi:hypothetical protein